MMPHIWDKLSTYNNNHSLTVDLEMTLFKIRATKVKLMSSCVPEQWDQLPNTDEQQYGDLVTPPFWLEIAPSTIGTM